MLYTIGKLSTPGRQKTLLYDTYYLSNGIKLLYFYSLPGYMGANLTGLSHSMAQETTHGAPSHSKVTVITQGQLKEILLSDAAYSHPYIQGDYTLLI